MAKPRTSRAVSLEPRSPATVENRTNTGVCLPFSAKGAAQVRCSRLSKHSKKPSPTSPALPPVCPPWQVRKRGHHQCQDRRSREYRYRPCLSCRSALVFTSSVTEILPFRLVTRPSNEVFRG